MQIEILDLEFSICKLENISEIDFSKEYIFLSKTDDEISLVCNTENVPPNTVKCENGWKAIRVKGVLDFTLVGILANISKILSDRGISIFAISTYNTDYIFIKKERLHLALDSLQNAGYDLV